MDRRFSEDEASRIWRRAAELQSARRLPSATSRSEHGEAIDQLSSTDIVAIAREAGIDASFVEQALSEAAFTPAALAEDAAFRVTREVEGEPAEVQVAVQEVITRAPFKLRLIDIRVGETMRALTFDVPVSLESWGGALQAGSLAAASNIIALHVLLRPGSRPGMTEVVLHGEDNPNLQRSVRNHDIGFGTLGGLLGAGAGAGVAAGLSLTGAVIAAPVAAGALLLGGLGVKIMHGAQRWAVRKDATTMEQLANEIAGAVRIRRHGGA